MHLCFEWLIFINRNWYLPKQNYTEAKYYEYGIVTQPVVHNEFYIILVC